MLIYKIDHYVKLEDFARALTDHYFTNNTDFDRSLKKTEAKKILERGLFFNGLNGEYADGFFEASFEEGRKYNNIFLDALDWVGRNYPHLKHKQDS